MALAVLGLVVAGIASAWLLWPGQPDEPPVPEPPPRPVLQLDSTGDDVRVWQEHLGAVGHSVAVDGVFGPATERATKAFQLEEGLRDTGVVDAATWEAMSRRLG